MQHILADGSCQDHNGYSSKTLLCDDGEIELNTPRDRENTVNVNSLLCQYGILLFTCMLNNHCNK
ncbi:hypothetical protein FQQ78_19110 [Salmonella enterica]|nr:hypothetical protein [Salmonella enterica]ECJ9933746.1 hypothetical protein [Salmonella enterica]ECQ0197072.1 hypothetical protein [Salmonella enterica]